MRDNSVQGIERGELLAPDPHRGLERSCTDDNGDGMRISNSARGIERIEARFHGNGFSPHRHDTYALGLTLHGIQTFHYRGTSHFSRPGNVIILHPDEVHDGAAGTDLGLIYRMIYLPPQLLAAVGDYRHALPFAPDPVTADATLWQALAEVLDDLEHAPSELLLDDVVLRVSDALNRHAGGPTAAVATPARVAVMRTVDFLESHYNDSIGSEDLEAVSGLSRFELARQFRRLMGTSPHRYMVLRRLDQAKQLLSTGVGLADAAAAAGFADQPHFTRHFRKTFGMTPGRWLALRSGGK
ncbi:AraC family transcriptional regulator [Rhizobium sp. SAFR-030]|uniref:AraC family transcriptional regulator n=1 Tax=Rhizobium sp. SAFR-030 TaxID=3387277 RepID=UPI003F7E5D63